MTPEDPRHGTLAGQRAHYDAGSPACAACLAAKNEYAAHVRRQQAYGRWNPWTDATPARNHVLALMEQGMGQRLIAREVGVLHSRISHLVWGRDGSPPPKKIRPEYAAKVLAVQPAPRCVPIIGTRRRLGGLMAIGYSQPFLARELGITQGRVWGLLNQRDAVERETHTKVAALFERLCMTLPAETTRAEKFSASRARNTARRNGFVHPLAWDDIDDPAENPKGLVGREKNDTSSRAELLAELNDRGATVHEVSRTLGISADGLYMWCRRNDHLDTWDEISSRTRTSENAATKRREAA